MDPLTIAAAYCRRAEARERDRIERFRKRRAQARGVALDLSARFGDRIHVVMFGSLLDLDRFRLDSDIDLAVEGLSASEYWEALALVERQPAGARVDLIRIESASAALRETVRQEGEVLS